MCYVKETAHDLGEVHFDVLCGPYNMRAKVTWGRSFYLDNKACQDMVVSYLHPYFYKRGQFSSFTHSVSFELKLILS